MGISRAIRVGLTIIGTTIGAGFASGREMWEFFSSYGKKSQYSVLLAMLLFFVVVSVVMWISTRKETSNYLGILEELMGKRLASVFDVLTMLYLLSMSVVMFAGSGATFAQWNYSYFFGVLLIAACVFIVLIFNIDGLVSIQTMIIPVLVGVLLIVCVQYISGFESVRVTSDTDLTSWPSGITYAALNIVPLMAVISTIGSQLKSTKELWVSAIISTVGLGLIAVLMNQSLLLAGDSIAQYEIPLFGLLKEDSMSMIVIVSVILWLAIYTTALSGVHGIVSRVDSFFSVPTWVITFILIVGMVPFSLFGFSRLVSILYPIYGVLNLFVLGLIILYPIHKRLD